MEQNLDNKIDLKSRIINFYNIYKAKIKLFCLGALILFIASMFLQINNEKKNNEISEKYINAGIFFSKNEKKKSKKLFEEILNSNNSFYTMLALNNIIEKDLEDNEDKIIKYFNKVEKLQKNKEQRDILKFKKALFLLKKLKNQEANKLLNELKESNSTIKNLAEEILVN